MRQRKGRKSSRIEFDKRVEEVRFLILSGMDSVPIVQFITEKCSVKERMARHYLAKARARNQAFVKQNEAEMFAEHIALQREMRLRARRAGNAQLEL